MLIPTVFAIQKQSENWTDPVLNGGLQFGSCQVDYHLKARHINANQTSANRGPDSRFIVEAISKPLVPKYEHFLYSHVVNIHMRIYAYV